MVIWKYEFPDERKFKIPIPAGAIILDVQVQYGRPRMWALVDPDREKTDRRFSVYMTGEHLEDPGTYIASFQEGPFVGHIFEDRTPVI